MLADYISAIPAAQRGFGANWSVETLSLTARWEVLKPGGPIARCYGVTGSFTANRIEVPSRYAPRVAGFSSLF